MITTLAWPPAPRTAQFVAIDPSSAAPVRILYGREDLGRRPLASFWPEIDRRGEFAGRLRRHRDHIYLLRFQVAAGDLAAAQGDLSRRSVDRDRDGEPLPAIG